MVYEPAFFTCVPTRTRLIFLFFYLVKNMNFRKSPLIFVLFLNGKKQNKKEKP